MRILQVGTLAGEAITQQAQEKLLRGFLRLGIGMLKGKIQQGGSCPLQMDLTGIRRERFDLDRKVEDVFQTEQEMGDLSRFSRVASNLLHFATQRPKSSRQPRLRLIEALGK